MPEIEHVKLLIASYLEDEYVDQVRAVDSRLDIVNRPDLLPKPRYRSDHYGHPFERTPEQEAEWQSLLAEAQILFDFDETHREDLPELAPNVKWIQASASGIGRFVAEMGYAGRMPNTVITNTKGVHGQPLAEFCLMAILMLRKGVLQNLRNQARRHWERYGGTDLEGRTAVVVGLGEIGMEVARVCRAMRMHVIGVGRSKNPDPDRVESVDEYVEVSELRNVLPRAEHLILVLPHTPVTEDLFGAEEFALLPEGAVIVNIGRGQVVDEVALVDALRSGHLAGAALDVFKEEPLPPESPFWDLPNVYVSPHSGSTTPQENRRITDFFCKNLRRYLDGRPLMNVLERGTYY